MIKIKIYIYISTTEVIGSTSCSAACIFVFTSYLYQDFGLNVRIGRVGSFINPFGTHI